MLMPCNDDTRFALRVSVPLLIFSLLALIPLRLLAQTITPATPLPTLPPTKYAPPPPAPYPFTTTEHNGYTVRVTYKLNTDQNGNKSYNGTIEYQEKGKEKPACSIPFGSRTEEETRAMAVAYAARAGDAELVKAMLKNDPTVLTYKTLSAGTNAILRMAAAAREKQPDCPAPFDPAGVIAALAEAKMDLNQVVNTGSNETALHYAAAAGMMTQVKALVTHGANINLGNAEGRTAYFLATLNGCEDVAQYLREKGSKPLASGSLLQVAVAEGNLDEVKKLLQATPKEISAKGPKGYTLLHLAAACKQLEVAKLLLEKKDPKNKENNADVQAVDSEGLTPLHIAAGHADTAMTKLLLEHGAKLEASADSGRMTPSFFGQTPEKIYSDTPLLYSISNMLRQAKDSLPPRYKETFLLLLAHKANINATSSARQKSTPLFDALNAQNVPLTQFLLQHGADPNSVSNFGSSALQMAAISLKSLALTKVLVENGAKVNAQGKDGSTVLDGTVPPPISPKDPPAMQEAARANAARMKESYGEIRKYLVAHGAHESITEEKDINAMGIMPDGHALVTGMNVIAKRARKFDLPERSYYCYQVMNLNTGRIEKLIRRPFSDPVTTGYFHPIAFLPDGHSILERTKDYTVEQMNIQTGKSEPMKGNWHANYIRHLAGTNKAWFIKSAQMQRDGTMKASIALVDYAAMKIVREVPLNNPRWLELNRDGSIALMLSGTPNAKGVLPKAYLHFIDLTTGKEISRSPALTDIRTVLMEISNDGRTAVTLSYAEKDGGQQDTRLTLWDVRTGHERKSFTAKAGTSFALFQLSPDSRLLAYNEQHVGISFGNQDMRDNVTVWDTLTGAVRCEFRPSGTTGQLCFSPNSAHLITATKASPGTIAIGPVEVWDTHTGKKVHAFTAQ